MRNIGLKKILSKGEVLRRLRPTLAQTIVLSCLIGVIGSCFIAGYNAQSIVQNSKLTDNWAIMFLESENMGFRLRSVLESLTKEHIGQPDLNLSVGAPSQMIEGKTQNQTFQVSTAQLGFDSDGQLLESPTKGTSLLYVSGSAYMVVSHDANNLKLIKVPAAIFASVLGRAEKKARVIYLVSKQGRVLYSSDDKINNENFLGRDLVKKFLQSSLSGQIIEYQGSNNRRYYGAVQEISGTNLVLFSEVSRELLIGSMAQALQQYALIVVVLVTLIVVLISLPIVRLTSSLALLNRFARHLGTGDFTSRIKVNDCLETEKLGHSLNEMAQSISELNASFSAEMEDKFVKATSEFKRNVLDDVQSILQASVNSSAKQKISASMSYIEADAMSSAVCFDLSGSQGSIQSLFISEVRAELAEAMIYQSVVGSIVNNGFKNSFEDVKTVIRKIDDVPKLINQAGVESAQYHITKDPRSSELILKVWSRFGLSMFGLQAVLTAERKLDLEKSSILDLGQKTIFERTLVASPGSVIVLVCHPSSTPVIRDLENCPKGFKDDAMAILSGIKLTDSLAVNFEDVEKGPRSLESSGQLGLLVVGNF
jgi:methyl-accepting chemotaxis protein